MFIIPKYNVNNTSPIVELTNNSSQNIFELKPKLYIVQQYPLNILTCFIYRLFNPFLRFNYKVTSIHNNTDNVNITLTNSLATLTVDRYVNRFTDFYLVTGLGKEIEFKVTIFTEFDQSTLDIRNYPFLDLESINITGHIGSFTYENNIITLTENFIYPLPVALNFSVVINTSDIMNRKNIYQVPVKIGYTPDYVLYENKYFVRSRNDIPISNEFTYTNTGALLWI